MLENILKLTNLSIIALFLGKGCGAWKSINSKIDLIPKIIHSKHFLKKTQISQVLQEIYKNIQNNYLYKHTKYV